MKSNDDLPSPDYDQKLTGLCDVPGSCGWSLINDKSLDFYRNTSSFITRHISECQCRIFKARLLNRPTVFLASNEAVQEMLNDKSNCFEMGYKDYFYDVFGDNILFTNEEETKAMKMAMEMLFQKENINTHNVTIQRISDKFISNLKEENSPECMYQYFKKMCLHITLSIFLGVDDEKESDLLEKLINLTTTHWHGLISVPVRFKLHGFLKTGFSQALQARNELLQIIMSRLDDCDKGIFGDIKTNGIFRNQDEASQNILLFISALIPKALASLITSFVLSHESWSSFMKSADILSDSGLECILLEVMRLYPPFLGGRRVAKQACKLSGFHIPKGMPVIYLNEAAQRDPHIFCDSEKFDPIRWKECNAKDRDKLFLFGSGPRKCVGWYLSWNILECVCSRLQRDFTWQVSSTNNNVHGQGDIGLHYKWLPVTRPKHVPKVIFIPKPAVT